MKTSLPKVTSFFFNLCLVFLFLSSCTKGDEPKPNNTGPACRITKFYHSDDHPTHYTIYQYDNQDKLLQTTTSYQGKENKKLTYEYNPQGQLIKLTINQKYFINFQEQDLHLVITFDYNLKGQIVKYVGNRIKSQNNSTTPSIYEVLCEYNSEGNRTKTTLTYAGSNTSIVNVFTYQDGNCIKAVNGLGSHIESTTEFEYYLDQEDQQRPFNQSSDLTFLTLQSAPKNMLKKTVHTYKQQADSNTTDQYSYEYNDKGFPTKQITASTNKNFSFSTINRMVYECW